MKNCDECEFKNFVMALGPWFDGFAKFVNIMKGHNSDIYTGQQLMLQKLAKESSKMNKYMLDCRTRYSEEQGLTEESDNDSNERSYKCERQ